MTAQEAVKTDFRKLMSELDEIKKKVSEAKSAMSALELLTDSVYKDGIKKAWELAQKIETMKAGEVMECFGLESDDELPFVMSRFSYAEAQLKVNAYENRKREEAKIQVGDEVLYSGAKGVVYKIDSDTCYVLWGTDQLGTLWHRDSLTKTGKHYDEIANIRQELTTWEF